MKLNTFKNLFKTFIRNNSLSGTEEINVESLEYDEEKLKVIIKLKENK